MYMKFFVRPTPAGSLKIFRTVYFILFVILQRYGYRKI